LARKLGFIAWLYIASILVNVGVSTVCLLRYFEPAFRESRITFNGQQQLERLRGLVRHERTHLRAGGTPDAGVFDSERPGESLSRAVVAMGGGSLSQSLGPLWGEIQAEAADLARAGRSGERLTPERLASIESRLTLAIDSLGARRQHSLARAFQAQRWVTGLLVLNSVLGAVLCAAGLWFVRGRVVRPAAVLKEAIGRIRQGDFDPRIRMPFEDEMGMLGREIGVMARQIGRLQGQLVDRERRAAAGELVDRVEQRVREPLSHIRQLALASSQRNTDYEEIAECQGGIGTAVEKFEEWLGQLRAGLACAVGKPGPSRVSDLFADVLAAVRPTMERYEVTLSLESSPELDLVTVDRLQFEQALISLVINAIQASTAGQTVRVTARLGEAGSGQWELEVADEGSGIEPGVLDQIFLPFFTTKRDGNGLGLSMVKSIVEQQAGEVRVSSLPGQGSRFTLRLPLKATLTPEAPC
jgi:signal transduction histidine kinase